MTDTYVCSGWACSDCLSELANGESPADLSADGIAERNAMISARNAGYDITLGLLREDHTCLNSDGQTAGDLGGECDCEVNTFSWSPCDVCGSNLGGERHAVSFFKINS